jgi:hypothetical protein
MLKQHSNNIEHVVSVRASFDAVNVPDDDINRECQAYSEHIETVLDEYQDKLAPKYLPFDRTLNSSPKDSLLGALRDGTHSIRHLLHLIQTF